MRITVSRTYFIKLIAESFVLFIVLMLTSSLAENNSPSLFGLPVLSESDCSALCKGKREILHPDRLHEHIQFDDKPISYDEITNTCYIVSSGGAQRLTDIFLL